MKTTQFDVPQHVDEVSNTISRILVLLAHPSLDRSEVNRPMAEAIDGLDGVTLIDLYAEYPDFQIDIDREQAQLLSHDVVVFQHPLYWYSTPAILKEWQDLVLEHGFAYGTGGTKLAGKTFFCALTAGGPQEAYHKRGYNHFTMRELFVPLEQTANLCGMTWLPPFALYAARRAHDEGRVEAHADEFVELLTALSEDRISIHAASRRDLLNGVPMKPAKAAMKAAAKAGR